MAGVTLKFSAVGDDAALGANISQVHHVFQKPLLNVGRARWGF